MSPQGGAAGNSFVYITKFSTTGALDYSAVVGNSAYGGYDLVGGIAADASGDAYITGVSGALWPTTSGAFQTSILGTNDSAVYVAQISADASHLIYSTFLSGGGQSIGIVLDGNGDAIVAGPLASGLYPTTASAYEKTLGPSSTVSTCCASFFTELNQNGSQLVYSSFFYGDPSLSSSVTRITSLARDALGNIWLAGNSSDVQQFPLVQPLQFFPGYNPNAHSTGFVSRFDPTGNHLTFSTYFGDPALQTDILGIAVDAVGKAHIAGYAGSGLFTAPAAYLAQAPVPAPANQPPYGFAAEMDAVVNCGTLPLAISDVQSSSPFFTLPAGLQDCAQPLATNSSCTLPVAFAPTVSNTYSGVLTFTSNASITHALLPMEGTGLGVLSVASTDFSFSPVAPGSAAGSTAATVKSGQTASYLLALQAGAAYTGNVSLTCAQVPSTYHCTITPPSPIPLSPGNNVSFTVSVATATTSAYLPNSHLEMMTVGWAVFALLALSSFAWSLPKRWTHFAILLGLLASLTGLASCGGSSNSSGSSSTPPSQTIGFVINASDGTISHSLPITLTVQQ